MEFDYNDFDLAFESLISHAIKLDKIFINNENIPRDNYHSDLYHIWIKGILHVYSVKHLINGTYAENFDSIFYDYSSAYIIARALYECVLTMYYIFFDFKSVDEKEIKYLIWDYCSYHERQKFISITKETAEKKKEEKFILDSIKTKIITSNYYKSLDARNKSKIDKRVLEKGEWKFDSWNQIGKKMGLSLHYRRDVYKLLCGYAHTGKHSIFQLTQSKDNEKRKELMFIPNSITCLSIANLIDLIYETIDQYDKDVEINISENEIEYYHYYMKVGKEEL